MTLTGDPVIGPNVETREREKAMILVAVRVKERVDVRKRAHLSFSVCVAELPSATRIGWSKAGGVGGGRLARRCVVEQRLCKWSHQRVQWQEFIRRKPSVEYIVFIQTGL